MDDRGSKSTVVKNTVEKEQRVDGNCSISAVKVYSNGQGDLLSNQNPIERINNT